MAKQTSSLFAALYLLLTALPANAAIIYTFSFFNITQSGTNATVGPFEVTLRYDDFVTETGMKLLPGPAQPTTLGYPVQYAGTDGIGIWGFDDDGAAFFYDDGTGALGFSFADTSFIYGPLDSVVFTNSIGTFPGMFTGNGTAGGVFSALAGDALLVVTASDTTVPEPATLALLALGLAGLGWSRRRK